MRLWAILMLVSGGLFAGGVTVFTWERIPVWRALPLSEFRIDFAGAIHKADRVQPALLAVAIATTVGFALTTSGAGHTLALVGAAGFGVILISSGAILVPLQRRIITSSQQQPVVVDAMRRRWFAGHLGRAVAAVASFILVAVAAAM